MKIIIAPDSFKETMANTTVSKIIAKTLQNKYPSAEVLRMPVADGGEGSIDAITATSGKVKKVISHDANNNVSISKYAVKNNAIIIEVAQNVGFKYKKKYSNPGNTTTVGIGEVIKKALKQTGLKTVYICLGGTITNDGGVGIAYALGVKFFDKNGKDFLPTGNTLKDICKIDNTDFIKNYGDVSIIGLCDVVNPLFGENGASFIYAPQKGATKNQVVELDNGLKHLNEVAISCLNIDNSLVAGSGAAGGIGYGIITFLNAKLVKGIDTVLEIIGFDKQVANADYVITGEGKIDYQSLMGKVIFGILNHSKDKKVIAVVGKMDGDEKFYLENGLHKIVVTNSENLPFEKVKKICKKQLKNAILNLEL